MSLGAFVWHRHHHGSNSETDIAWASLIAVLFAAVASISFAVDQSVTLSDNLPPPAAHSSDR